MAISAALCCSTCKSDDVRKLSLIYENGFSRIESTTRGRSVGLGLVGGGLGIGAARSKNHTSGVQLTELAKRAAPPSKIPYEIFFPLLITCLVFVYAFHSDLDSGIFKFFLLGLFGVLGMLAYAFNHNENVWVPRYEQWNRMYMCERCGFVYEPSHTS